MSDQLDILIKVKADLAAAQETVAELKELKRQAIAAGVSTGDLDKQIAAEQSQASAGKKLEDSTKKNTGHIEGLHKSVKLLQNQFGEFGHLAHFAMMSGPALAIAAVGMALGGLNEKLKEMREKYLAAIEKAEALDRVKLDTLKQAIADAEVEMVKFNTGLTNAGTNADTLKTKMDNLRAAYKGAGLTDDQADANELKKRTAAEEGLDWRAAVAKDKLLKHAQDKDFISAKANLATSEEEDAKKRSGALATILEKTGMLAVEQNPLVRAKLMLERYFAEKKLDQANAEIAKQETKREGWRETVKRHEIAGAGLEDEAQRTEATAKANKAAINELEGKKSTSRSGIRGEVSAYDLAVAEDLSGRAMHGEKLGRAEQSLVVQIASVATGKSVDFATAVKALEYEKRNTATHTKLLERLIALNERDKGALNGFASRIDNLERLFRNVPTRP